MAKFYAKVMFDNTRIFNDYSEKYDVVACQLEADAVKVLEGEGCTVRTCDREDDKNRGKFVTLGSKYPISVKDKHKKPLPEDVMMGNGSEILVLFEPYSGTHKKHGPYTIPSVKVIQCKELVEYIHDDGLDDELDDSEDEAPFDLDDELD